MNDLLAISPCGPIIGTIRPPGSKSITNRALICAALAAGRSTLTGVLDSEDTQVMIGCLQQLGFPSEHDLAARRLTLDGGRAIQPAAERIELFVGNSGTTVRFLTAMLAARGGRYRLDGVPRMRQRPIGDLLRPLQELGADVRSEANTDCPPVLIDAAGLRGGTVNIRGDISSQFLSGLLMASPLAAGDVEIVVDGPLVSRPYVHLTAAVMGSFGVPIELAGDLSRFHVPSGRPYRATEYAIEPDASAASYFWAAAAVTGGQVTVPGLSRRSLQGDVAFCDCLAQMGCTVNYQADTITVTGGELHGIDVDMNSISDTVQTLAAVALFARGPTTIRGVGHIRHKETDRIGDLARELRRVGAAVDETADGLRIIPGLLRGAELETYRDHRMAMSLSLIGLRVPGIAIRDPACTAKTYPGFFTDLARLRG